MSAARTYNSPLRDERARQTREAILAALFALMDDAGAPDEIAMEAIAERAGVQRRTVFRHFPTKADLLAAFWPWLNARIGAATEPETLRDILDGPRRTFPRFDAHEAAIRAALHSRTGREMRMDTVAGRREHFARALGPALHDASPVEAAKLEALAHLLYSAAAWEVLKDYAGLSGAEAGETAAWALETVLSAVTAGRFPAGGALQPEEPEDEL